MTNMVERVARVIANAIDNDVIIYRWLEYGIELPKSHMDTIARDIIQEMMEPTEAMMKAAEYGEISYSYGDAFSEFNYISKDNAKEMWKDMLTAALNPPDADASWQQP